MSRTEQSPARRTFYVIAFALFFGVISGLLITYTCARFVPVLFTDWAGSFVCDGKMIFNSGLRTYDCYTTASKYYQLGDKVFNTMFKIFVFPSIGISSILLLALFAFTDSFIGKRYRN